MFDGVLERRVLFLFRTSMERNIENGRLDLDSEPRDFLWGANFLKSQGMKVDTLAVLRGKPSNLWDWMFVLFDKFCAKFLGLGLPLEVFPANLGSFRSARDVVCTNDQLSLSILFWKRLGFLRQKRIHCVVMSLPERLQYAQFTVLFDWLSKRLLRGATTIFTISELAREEMIRRWGLSPGRVRNLNFGVDTSFWTPADSLNSPNHSYILAVGNDVRRDFGTLLEAMPPDFPLKVLTKSSLPVSSDRVEHIQHWISAESLRDLYRNAAVVVVPTESQKFEMSGLSTILQALACGARVISSGSPPIEQYLASADVVFCEPRDVHSLRLAITRVLDQLQNNDPQDGPERRNVVARQLISESQIGPQILEALFV